MRAARDEVLAEQNLEAKDIFQEVGINIWGQWSQLSSSKGSSDITHGLVHSPYPGSSAGFLLPHSSVHWTGFWENSSLAVFFMCPFGLQEDSNVWLPPNYGVQLNQLLARQSLPHQQRKHASLIPAFSVFQTRGPHKSPHFANKFNFLDGSFEFSLTWLGEEGMNKLLPSSLFLSMSERKRNAIVFSTLKILFRELTWLISSPF